MSTKYPGTEELANQWESFNGYQGTPVTKGTIAYYAKENGWCKQSTDFDAALETGKGVKDLDHSDLAHLVLKLNGRENLLSTTALTWRWYKTGVWRVIADRELKNMVQHGLKDIGKKTQKSTVDAVMDVLKTEIFAPEHQWNREPDVINFQNGEARFDGDKWMLEKHKRENFLTTQIPFSYDPTAKAPRFMQFLREVFEADPDCEEKVCLVLEAIGYTLASHTKYEKFIILLGSGANGKSVLLDVIRELVGAENVAAVQPSQFSNRFQRAHLHQKLANLVTEIAEGSQIADAELKAIVSGELMTSEHKHQSPFDFRPFTTCWFGANHLPHTRDFSDALFRRAFVIPFNRTFKPGEGADPNLKNALVAEIPGIIQAALNAYGNVIKQGGKFSEPLSCIDAKTEWRYEADQVAQFVNDACISTPGAKTASSVLYNRYTDWARDYGISKILNRKNFTTRLSRIGYNPARGAGGKRMIDGIVVKALEDFEDLNGGAPQNGHSDLI